jgi:hypothetical protein
VTSDQRRGWIRLLATLVILLGGLAMVSWPAALVVAVVLTGGYGLLWLMVAVGFDAIIWVLDKAIEIGESAFDAAMAPRKAILTGSYADIARHQELLRAFSPERFADVEKEMHERRAIFIPSMGPFDYEGTLARYRTRQAELMRSAEPFIRELRDGNQRYHWFDAEELAEHEREIHQMRSQLLRARSRLAGG